LRLGMSLLQLLFLSRRWSVVVNDGTRGSLFWRWHVDSVFFRWEIGSFSAGFNLFYCSRSYRLWVSKKCVIMVILRKMLNDLVSGLFVVVFVKGFLPFFQDMQDMRDCYDSLLSAAAATQNSAYGNVYTHFYCIPSF